MWGCGNVLMLILEYDRDGSERGDGYLNVAGIMDKILKMIMAVTEAKA